jgi:hypothetical protein
MVGTMIEIPRAALTADEIAETAEFFSFGTNDLTQMTFGFSRDDIGTFLPDYLKQKILPRTRSRASTRRRRPARRDGRRRRAAHPPGLKCGICGEHGGDPASVKFCTGRPRLRELLPVPRAHRPPRRRPGRHRVAKRAMFNRLPRRRSHRFNASSTTSNNFRTASAIASGFRAGTTKPFTPSLIKSATAPHTSDAMTGTPHANASLMTSPQTSLCDGNANTSATP